VLKNGAGSGFSEPRYLVFGRSGDLVPTFSISGTVTQNGAGLAGVTVSAGGSFATTAANGTYTIPGLSSGNYTVTPSRSGFTFMPASQNANVAGANVGGVNFTATAVAATYSISGAITENGTGLQGVTVSAGGQNTATNGLGAFVISGLPAGNYTVTPSKASYT
jgi:inhibitor of cysteine peptidase